MRTGLGLQTSRLSDGVPREYRQLFETRVVGILADSYAIPKEVHQKEIGPIFTKLRQRYPKSAGGPAWEELVKAIQEADEIIKEYAWRPPKTF